MVRGHVSIIQVIQQTRKEQPKTKDFAARVPGWDLLQQLMHLQDQGCSDRQCLKPERGCYYMAASPSTRVPGFHHLERGSITFITYLFRNASRFTTLRFYQQMQKSIICILSTEKKKTNTLAMITGARKATCGTQYKSTLLQKHRIQWDFGKHDGQIHFSYAPNLTVFNTISKKQ